MNIILGIAYSLVIIKIMVDDLIEKAIVTLLNVTPILSFWVLGIFNIFNLPSLYNYLIVFFVTIVSVATVVYFKILKLKKDK